MVVLVSSLFFESPVTLFEIDFLDFIFHAILLLYIWVLELVARQDKKIPLWRKNGVVAVYILREERCQVTIIALPY